MNALQSVEAHALGNRDRDPCALRSADLAVRSGSVLALLGDNGAGKTTPTIGSTSAAGAPTSTGRLVDSRGVVACRPATPEART